MKPSIRIENNNIARMNIGIEDKGTLEKTLSRRHKRPPLDAANLRLPRRIVNIVDVHQSTVARRAHKYPIEATHLGLVGQKIRPFVVLPQHFRRLVVTIRPADVPWCRLHAIWAHFEHFNERFKPFIYLIFLISDLK